MDTLRINALRLIQKAILAMLLLAAAPGGSWASGQTAEQSFAAFAQEWVQQIQNAYLYTHKAPKLESTATGFVASYHYLDKASIQWDVKPAEGQESVYTGVLYYTEHLVQSRAPTEELARGGPFSIVSTRQMMEIFLYENGAWVR